MKKMCSLCYYHNRFVETHALTWYMVTSYAQVHELWQSHCGNNWMSTLLRAHCFHDCIYMYIYYNHLASVRFEHTVYIKVIYIYVYIYIYMQSWKKMCPPSYHHNAFVETHTLTWYMVTSYAQLDEQIVTGTLFWWLRIYIYIYITTILVLWD